MCEYCEKKIKNLNNAKITPQTYINEFIHKFVKPLVKYKFEEDKQ